LAKSSAVDESQSSSLFARLSISLRPELVVQLDAMMAERGLPSRSQVIAELIRHELADFESQQADSVIAGTITLIYRAESGRVRHALAQTQSAYLMEVISSQHVFLEDDQSLEVLLVQGPAARLRQLCDDLRRIRSVQQIKLVTTTALLPPLHAHGEGSPSDLEQPLRRQTSAGG
jgi:CopG family nickel-responsive transcriptional regulator